MDVEVVSYARVQVMDAVVGKVPNQLDFMVIQVSRW